MSAKPTFPDPNRSQDEWNSDVATYGTCKAFWWRIRSVAARESGSFKIWMIRRWCRSLARSPVTPIEMKPLLASVRSNLRSMDLRSMSDFVIECRMQERVRRGDD